METRDLSLDSDRETPWHLPISGKELAPSLTTLGRTRPARTVTRKLIGLLERTHLAPAGSSELYTLLDATADWLVKGGETQVFTPLYFFLARK